MCGKPVVNTSVMSSEDDDNEEMQQSDNDSDNSSGGDSDDGGSPKKAKVKVNRRNETPEEKQKRRKVERKKRVVMRRQAKGQLVTTKPMAKKVLNLFNQVWERENKYVTQVMECLPEVRQPGLLLDEEERAEEYVSVMNGGKKSRIDEEREKQKALAKIGKNLKREGFEANAERATSYQELRARLQKKLAEKAQEPNAEKRAKKLKKKLRKQAEAKKEKSNKGKKLISQSASLAGGAEDSSDIKTETTEKTPLKKKPVVKSNGEIVYSKFDFISKEGGSNGVGGASSSLQNKKGNAKPTAEDLLKKAVKHEKMISSLASKGKQSEAVDLAVAQKWDTALKRADGVKVKDDAYLLKKTIKKQEKQKQLTKKKWKERIEQVEKQKEMKQQKRQSNLQSRKDDKKKKVKKIMRKRGRIA